MKKLLVIGFVFLAPFFVAKINAQSPTIQSVSITSPILCYGDEASINIQINQTTPPTSVMVAIGYSINGFFVGWTSTPQTTINYLNVPNLPAQSYIIRLVDSVLYNSTVPAGQNSASIYDVSTINITQPLQLSNSATQINSLDCFGDCDGSALINIAGGTPPYSISFDGGPFALLPTTTFDSLYDNLCSGAYAISVTDTNGCTVSGSSPTSINISEPPQLIPDGDVSSNYNGADISCFGFTDGEITGSVSGGTSPYTYSLDGINYGSSSIFSSLSAGTYTIYYRDANGCDTSETITLNNPPDLSGTVSISQQVSCFGVCDGILDFQVSNISTGTPPYTYSINAGPFQNSPSFGGLCGNTTYSLTVQDANGCTANANQFLPEPTQVLFSDSLSDYNGFNISCSGLSDGSIHFLNPSGGNPPYTYSIDGNNFSTSMDYTGLSAGTYTLVVRDANGCEASLNRILDEPLPFSLNTTIVNNISCPGSCDGEVSVLPTNGISPILYDMTGYATQSSQYWTGMCGDITFGTYTLNATDANGCTSSTNVTLTEPLPFIYTVDSVTETCNLTNGEASIVVTQGGTTPYAYLWDDPSAQTTAVASNLSTGLYWVRVTDANGCEFLEDVFVDEADISLTFDSVPPCNGAADGLATVIPNGTPPYTVLWETGATTNTITGLNPGFYSVTVSDATGCSVTDSVEVPASAIVSVSLDAANSTQFVACNGFPSDTITINAVGGTGPGTYQYYIPGVFPTPQYNNIFSGLYAGTYDVYAFDANGCTDFISVTISEPDVIYFSATSSDVSCYNGSNGSVWIDSVSGGTPPYFYNWNTGNTTSAVPNLSAGTYTVTVTDVNNCVSNPSSVTVTVNHPSQLISSTNIIHHSSCAGSQTAANGEAEVLASGGTAGYNYLWSNGSNSNIISLLFPGLYTVQVTDANGCMVTDTAIINPGVNPELNVNIQNVSCFGANDGMITTSAISGTPPYLFSSDGGNTFVPLGTPFGPSGPAAYFITVVDNEGCTDSDSVFVNEPDELMISSLVAQHVLCYDSANGEILANVNGGTGSYTYLWNNGQTTNPAIGLLPSSYNVTVTDSMGCSVVSNNQIITQPDSLYIDSLELTHVSCNGGSDGSVDIYVNDGTPSYLYSLNGGAYYASMSYSNLSAGTYIATVTDANGCLTSSNFIISEPSPIAVQFMRDSVTCNGGADGIATAIVSGGTVQYNLLWDDGSTSSSVNTFSAGYHSLIITDANGCVFEDSVEILEPSYSVEIDSLIVTEISCNNANNASITILATGGYLPYVYSSTNGIFTQNSIGFFNLGPDQYIMYVRDSRGCIDRDTIIIDQPDSIYIDTTIFTHITCHGANDGAIQSINAYGGFQPYLYSVNGGAYHANMSYFNGYGPGTYTVQVVDSNNCSAQDIIIIEEPDELDVTISTSMWNGYEIRCHGDNSGFANISVLGGNGPYLKTVLDASGSIIANTYSNNIPSLSAGTYTFVITDNNGCSYQETLIYQQPDPISHSFITDHITCVGWSNGSITWNGYGGVGSATTYSYLWTTGDTTYTINNVGAGNYTITITDENNCVSSSTETINSSGVLNASIGLIENPSCWNYCDGQIEASVTGGVPNINGSGNTMYNYQWDDQLSQITQNAIGLCVDNISNSQTFTCVITDALGCMVTVSQTLTQPEKLEVDLNQTSEVVCFGGNEASLSASTSGGNPGVITYIWNTGQSNPSSSLSNLSAGTYVVVAQDSEGCMDTTNYIIDQPMLLEANILATDILDVLCYGDATGEISVTVTGGTVNVGAQYTYNWTPSSVGVSSSSYDFPTSTGTGTLSSIDTGIYHVEVMDINGCLTTSNIVYVAQPTNPLSIFTDSTDETCIMEGSATAYVLGGTPTYTYLWSPGGQTSATATSLSPNTTYVVEVTDQNGCTISDQTHINGYRNIFLPDNDDSFDSTICLGKSVFIEVEDQGYTYEWNTGETTPSITVSPEDPITIYTLSITDPDCPSSYDVTATFNVIKLDINPIATPNPLVFGDMITIESSYSYNDFVWTWDNDTATGMTINDYPESSTWYYVEATDNIGCKGVDSVYVVIGVLVYDAISPNGDGINDEWEIQDIDRYPEAEIQIFNRWGSLIFSSSGANYNNNKWNGEFENNALPIGTYYYTINFKDGSDLQSGPVTIVR